METLIRDFMTKTDSILKNQGASLKNLENQVGQLALAIHTRPQGSFPSDTENPRENNEQCKAIQLRNGREVQMPRRMAVPEQPSTESQSTETNPGMQESVEKSGKIVDDVDKSVSANPSIEQKPMRITPRYPQRLQKKNQDK